MALEKDVNVEAELDSVKEGLKYLQWLMTAIIIVLFIGFAGMFIATAGILIGALNDKTATYSDLIRKIDSVQSVSVIDKNSIYSVVGK